VPKVARSGADSSLALELSSIGRTVSPWQVERWRQAGLIPPATRRSLGRGAGSTAEYPIAAVEQAKAVATLVRRRQPLSSVAPVLFIRGYPVDVQVLRRAYGQWLDRIESWLGTADSDEGKFVLAERGAHQLLKHSLRTRRGRRLRRRAREVGEDPNQVAVSAYTNLLIILQGGEPPVDAIAEMLDVAGAGAVFRDQIPGAGPIAPGVDEALLKVLRQANLATLRRLVREASLEDFLWAREVLLIVAPFARAFAAIAQTAFRLPDAFGFTELGEVANDESMLANAIPMLLVIRQVADSEEARRLYALMRDHLDYYRASAAFLESLPTAVRQGLPTKDPHLLDALPPKERRRIRKEAAQLVVQADAQGLVAADEC